MQRLSEEPTQLKSEALYTGEEWSVCAQVQVVNGARLLDYYEGSEENNGISGDRELGKSEELTWR